MLLILIKDRNMLLKDSKETRKLKEKFEIDIFRCKEEIKKIKNRLRLLQNSCKHPGAYTFKDAYTKDLRATCPDCGKTTSVADFYKKKAYSRVG